MMEIQRMATLALMSVWGGKNADRAIKDALAQTKVVLTDHQKSSIQDGLYGVLRYRTELELVLAPLFQKRPPDPSLQILLLLATYQLLHTRLAPHAVVTHAVETGMVLAGEKVKGFINGVLRNLLRQKDGLVEQARSTLEGQYAHPVWWIARLQKDHPQRWEDYLREAQKPPPMMLRVNRRHNSVAQYLQNLKEHDMDAVPVGRDGLRLTTPVSVSHLPGFERGLVSVQDASAQVASALMGLHPGQRILDACAAPGGKTAHILESVTRVDMVALDKESERIRKMQKDMVRLKLEFPVLCADARETSRWWDGKLFDRILLDAPCSGSGVVRRHPDIKWLRQESDVPKMARQQLELLSALWPLLKKGGRLVYATCSVFDEENQSVIDGFLQRQSGVRSLDVSDLLEKSWVNGDADAVTMPVWSSGRICPDEDHDGFFYAALQKS